MAQTKKEKLLEKGKRIFNYSRNATQYQRWLTEAAEGDDLYEGNHWTQDELLVLAERGQAPNVVNKFATKIDALSGVEIENRTNIAYRPRTADPKAADIGLAYTYLASYHQERCDAAAHHSQAFKDMLVTGIGWIELDYDGENIIIGDVNPFEMIWDVDDTTPDMRNQYTNVRQRWMPLQKAIQQFPKHKTELEELAATGTGDQLLAAGPGAYTDTPGGQYVDLPGPDYAYFQKESQRVAIIEINYKELETVYKVRTEAGAYATFLNEKDAKKNKAKDSKVDEVQDLVNKFIFYTADVLLDEGVSIVQGEFFNYIPVVLKRGRRDNVPYGLSRAAKWPQYEYNKRRSKALHLLNAVRVTGDANAVESIEQLRKEVARPDSIVLAKQGTTLKIDTNVDLGKAQYDLLGISSQEIAEVTGVFDDVLGAQTNTTSGIAQAKREQSSVRTAAGGFSMLKLLKKRFGEALVYVMNEAYKDETHVPIMKNDKLVKLVKLNAETTNGDKLNSTAGIMFDIYVEQTPEYKSIPEEESEKLSQILMNGQVQVLAVPAIAAKLGFRDPEGLSEAVKQLLQPSQPQQGAGGEQPQPAGQPGSTPSPQ